MHTFTIDTFNTSDLQCTYVALGYLFKSIVDATFTLPEIFPVPSYSCPLQFSISNSALVSEIVNQISYILSTKIFTFYERYNLFSDTLRCIKSYH